MTTRSRVAILSSALFAVAFLALAAGPASASGGTPIYKHDNSGSDNWCALFANGQDMNRWAIRYRAHELDPTAVICQGHAYIFNFQTKSDATSVNYDPRDLYTTMELRAEDPANPGFPDITPAGLLASAGQFLVRPNAYSQIYGQFNYAPDTGQTIFLTWTEALTTAPSGGVVCQMIDTNNPRGCSNDSRSVAADGTSTVERIWDFIGSIWVVQTREVNLRFVARGSQRYPGDRGIPLVFTRRPNTGSVAETDDFISFDAVIDNAGVNPVNADFAVQVDRNVFVGGTPFWTDITKFFSPRITNPLAFPPGRTILSARIPRPVKDRFVGLFPINIPARALLTDPGTGALIDGEPGVWGLRASAGEFDAGTDDVAFIVRSPALTNDSVAVRFLAQDMPKTGYVLSGLGVAGVEVGSSGQPGFDAIEFRFEDPVTSLPDLSPNGLLRSVGVKDGVGEVAIGGAGGSVVDANFDIVDTFIDPQAGESTNFWVDVSFRPGDGVATGGTLLMADNEAATRLPNTYFSESGAAFVRVRDFMTQHLMAEVRLLIQNRFGTLESGPRQRPPESRPRLVTDIVDVVPRVVRSGESLPD